MMLGTKSFLLSAICGNIYKETYKNIVCMMMQEHAKIEYLKLFFWYLFPK